MKVDSIMWLLPVVFMVHDFEEIVMFKHWFANEGPALRHRFPRLAARVLPHMERLSTAAFALAVAEEFVLLSLFTLIAVEFGLYSLWASMLLGFFIHLLVHIGQFLVYRRYVPVILTSVLGSIYCLWALLSFAADGLLDWAHILLWTPIFVVAIVANGVFIHFVAARFEAWLQARQVNPVATEPIR